MLGNRIGYVIAALAFAYTPFFVRLTRGEVLKVRDSEYADAARVVGNPAWRVAFRHVFPNSVAPAVVLGPIVLGWAILDAAALGFLGIGIRSPTSEWGVMVADGAQNVDSGEWWTSAVPRPGDPRRRARLQLDRRRSAQPLPVGMSDEPILKVDGLSVSFPACATSARQVLDGVSFEVGRPESVALVGESGSGKSVTALSIMGLRPRARGSTAGACWSTTATC